MLFAGAVWELLRFAIVFYLFYVELVNTEVSLVGLVWFAAPGLALAAGYVFAAYRAGGSETSAILRMLTIGKLMGVIPAVVLVVLSASSLKSIASGIASAGTIFQLVTPVFVLLIDFLFFVFLIASASDDMSTSESKKPNINSGSPRQNPDENPSLPEYDETRVEED